jgi:hypothetical protein
MNITLTVGQSQTLTASFEDSMSNPVTDVNISFVVWSIDNNALVSIGPNVTSSTVPNITNPVVSGLSVVATALAAGIANVTATYTATESGVVFTNVTQITVVDPPVASIVVT